MTIAPLGTGGHENVKFAWKRDVGQALGPDVN
jgi:hypothetical protein